MIRYPKHLCPGATIAVTAPSGGVRENWRPKFDRTLQDFRENGYKVIEGQCLYGHTKNVSAPAQERASELMRFLCDATVDAIFPPCGGDLAIELLPLLDFDKLALMPPKWVMGFSDISTLLLPLTIISGWATAHGDHLIERSADHTEPLTIGIENVLQTRIGASVEQKSSTRYRSVDFFSQPPTPPKWTETRWKSLGPDVDEEVFMKGRLIGGCLDRIARLAGTKYGNIQKFVDANVNDGVILHLENAGMRPDEFARTLTALRLHGWFDSISGLMIGRSSGPDMRHPDSLFYLDALRNNLSGIDCPVIFDVDVGHQRPQLTLIQGALAQVRSRNGSGQVLQTFA